MKRSLHTRLLLNASISLGVLLILAGWFVYALYADNARQLRKERLQATAFSLIASAETDEQGTLRLTHIVPLASALLSEFTGLYAQIVSKSGRQVWYSPSMRTLDLDFDKQIRAGKSSYSNIVSTSGESFAVYNIGVNWTGAGSTGELYTVSVAEPVSVLEGYLESFRNRLLAGLFVVAIVIILVQNAILSRSLTPLREMHKELKKMDAGKQSSIAGHYPQELNDIAGNINGLIQSRQQMIDRNRHALSNLAHSLKTPLAVLQNILPMDNSDDSRTIHQQLDRIEEQIEYQLNQAATAGRQTTGTGVVITNVANKIIDSLYKVYRERDIEIVNQLGQDLAFQGDEGDLYELLGNVLDNACKYGSTHVELRGEVNAVAKKLILSVSDNGPGIMDDNKQALLSRGQRRSHDIPGHGIGLAVVKGIMDVYQGEIFLQDTIPQGLTVRLELPNS